MGEASSIAGVGGAGVAASVNKLLSNVMLDMLKQSLEQSGTQGSPQTQSAFQALRDLINGNQGKAADQVKGSDGASGPQGAGGPQATEQGDMKGLLQMLMQLLEMMMKMMAQMQDGSAGQGGANPSADTLARQLPHGDADGFEGFGDPSSSMDSVGQQQLM